MASGSRSKLVNPFEVGVYHCWNRCVRQEYLLGYDETSRIDSGRRSYIRGLQRVLASLFSIEVAFYATLDNHLHIILRNRPDVASQWDDREVVRRWLMITKLKRRGDLTVTEPDPANVLHHLTQNGRVETLRKRLANVSWFMGTLCENVSRRANAQDEKKGAFWEGRFRCRRLVDEPSVLVCGIYVDLNVMRSGRAETPDDSDYTSAFDRLHAQRVRESPKKSTHASDDEWLCQLTIDESQPVDAPEMVTSASGRRASDKGILPITLNQYLDLLNWTFECMRSRKELIVPGPIPVMLSAVGINAKVWLRAVDEFSNLFGSVVGHVQRLARVAASAGQKRFRGQSCCAQLFV